MGDVEELEKRGRRRKGLARLAISGPNSSVLFAFDEEGKVWCFGPQHTWQRASGFDHVPLHALQWDEV